MSTNSSFGLTMTCKNNFVDRPLVKRLIKQCGLQALPKIGAYVRKRARSILRRRKRVSKSGESPSVHSDDNVASLKNILFEVDPARSRVLIGPIKLNQVNLVADVGSQTVPEVMEFGGVVLIKEEGLKSGKPWRFSRDSTDPQWRRADLRMGTKPWKHYRIRRATYLPRPFMGPALAAEIEAGTIPQTLSGVLKVA